MLLSVKFVVSLNIFVRDCSCPKSCDLPYGTPSNVHNINPYENPTKIKSKPMVSFLDINSHAKARTLAFMCENYIPLSLTLYLIEYAKEMSIDARVLGSINMERTTASYKLREGLGLAYHNELVSELRLSKFSVNLVECFSAKNEKVLSILVAYYCETLKEVVVKRYASI